MRLRIVLGLVAGALLMTSACAEMAHEACVQRLSEHFAASRAFDDSPADLAQARSLLAQLGNLVASADTEGCKSQVVFGVSELKAAITDLQTAMSDGQIVAHGLFSLFGAQGSSPLSQQGAASTKRFDAAVKILKAEGITGLD